MYEIGLIGCGEIGSRHLQALKLSDKALQITAIDPSIDARQTAAQRADAIPSSRNIGVSYHGDIGSLPQRLKVAIVATSSRHRLRALQALLDHCSVEHIILEKVLFQRTADYYEAQQMLESSATTAWVNCPRRMMKSFRDLRPYVENYGSVSYRVTGTNWGMACNAIHFIDILSMYIGTQSYKLVTSGLDPTLHQSKRSGFVEFTGELSGRFERGKGSFLLQCDEGDRVSYTTEIENDRFKISFDSQTSVAGIEDKSHSTTSQIDFEMAYQSELSQLAIAQLIESNECLLPAYRESMDLHLPLIDGLQRFVETLTGEQQNHVDIT